MYNSLIGIYNIYPSLFDNMMLPADIDRQTTIDNILLTCGEFELLYAAPHFLSQVIGVWSRVNFYKFDKMFKSMNFNYDAIENYNRYEDFKESSIGNSLNSNENALLHTETTDNEKKVAGFETGKYVGSERTNSTGKTSGSESGSSAYKGDLQTTHSMHTHGNIGVTSTQDMIRQEREISDISIYNIIADSFKKEFCILKY